MLTLYHNNEEIPLQTTEYYVRELISGLDEVIFEIDLWDPAYTIINEEENLVDRGGQRYLVKQIDAGAQMVKIIAQLDLDEWKANMMVNYDSGSKTVYQQIDAVKPYGWTVYDRSGSTISRTLHGDFTPLQVCQKCCEVYSVYTRWDNKAKTITIYTKAIGSPVGSFATRELNLKEINYKGKSTDFVTRLYAYGEDGLTFSDINDGKPYVDDHTYSSRVISAIWRDDRYTVKQSLLDDARAKLARMAVPERSYDCSIVDLQATNPELYANLDFSLLTVATLIDDVKETAINYQVVERNVWPYHPDRNEVIFNDAPQKISTEIVQIKDEIENPASDFNQIMDNRIQAATDWLLSGEGYVVARQGSDGQWSEILIMDTNDEATATDVLRLNKNGIGFSTNGVNGPYTNAWTIDGNLVADFITTGTLTANVIKAGVLTDNAGKFSLNMTTGALVMNDGTFNGSINVGGGLGRNGVLNVFNSDSRKVYSLDVDGLTGYTKGSQGVGNWKVIYALNQTIQTGGTNRFALGGVAFYDANDMSTFKMYVGLTQQNSAERDEAANISVTLPLNIYGEDDISIIAWNRDFEIRTGTITLDAYDLHLGDIGTIHLGSDTGYTGTINGAEFINGICIGPA